MNLKPQLIKKAIIIVFFASFATMRASAQSDGISALFKGSPDDVNKLLNTYAAPLFKGFGNGLNGGWANTAKTQKFLRFAIRVSATGSIVPQSDKTYDVSKIGLSSRFSFPNGSIEPTFGGSTTAGPSIKYTDPTPVTGGSVSLPLPAGVVSIIPAPQVQLTIGLIKNTDLILRVIPDFQISKKIGSVGMFGVGFKHDIAQDFGTASNIIPFNLAIAVGYTHLNYKLPLDVKPDAGSTVIGSQDFTNQLLDGSFAGWNTQVIFSKKLLFFTPFVALGYLSSTTNVGLKGNYPFVTGATITGKPVYTSYADPINISGSTVSAGGGRADIGFQMSLSFFKLYGSYSFAQYQSFNAGIGLGF
ncbi:hypothetical protein BDD43_2788 [Mucilaginibacter gracilis]|uniref:Outer membrane protein with beta-barrel domain n=1 Tax=Mucilaginibacter gracilis TaxID=423350 RepID=A0A495J1F7_9SPHI|nr:DUF6588 family protein [Mucilaginibacter gracilis]RKR82603.1 hypothetical protein BDD43_2788 [Mucilaginibacter gracilis]